MTASQVDRSATGLTRRFFTIMKRPLLLDLFCGAGGAAVGYHRAGFDIVGVDIKAQPRYPFEFHQFDALDILYGDDLGWCDAIHASPPCQRFSTATMCRRNNNLPDLVTPTLAALQRAGKPWVLENVMGAPLSPFAAVLCGLSFGLKVFRHRQFASSHLLFSPEHVPHRHHRIGVDGMVCVVGHGAICRVPADHKTVAAWSAGMGIDWMTRIELSQAIPPAYTEYVGKQLLEVLQ